MVKVAIFGASGYVAGELIRLLLQHSSVELALIASESHKGKFLHQLHPNLRKIFNYRLEGYDLEKASKCDIAFVSSSYNSSLRLVPALLKRGLKVIDLTPMFRLKDPADYIRYYGFSHPHPDILKKAVYGLPELNRSEIKDAELVSCPGCIATSSILALYPLVKEGIVDSTVIIDSKMGSSGSGSKNSFSSIHSQRANSIRAYKPINHRHTPEIEQELARIKKTKIALSAHAVDIVRGLLATLHCFIEKEVEIKDLWRIYRTYYVNEKFIRIVREERGIYRYPDPKNLIGSNFCDIGFEIDESNRRLVLISALDNLVKGAAGNAVQCMNIMFGFDEAEGLYSSSPFP